MIELKPAINEVKLTLKSISSPINLGTVMEPSGGGGGGSVPTEVRQAIYTLLENAAYATTGLETEIATVEAWASEVTSLTLSTYTLQLSADIQQTIEATTTPAGLTVIWTSSDDDVATVEDGVVTGVNNGTCTITASCGSLTATCAVTVSGFVTLESISAVYTQSGEVYDTTPLDSLRDDLVVTGHYSDSSTRTITNYTLSGTLEVGTSTVTVSYGGFTTTFSVTVTQNDTSLYNWDFTQSLVDSKQGQTAVIGSNVSRSSAGLSFTTGASAYAYLCNIANYSQVTIEVDITTLSINSSADNRFLNFSNAQDGTKGYGFYHRGDYWRVIDQSGTGVLEADPPHTVSFFNGKTLKYQFDLTGKKRYVYADGELVMTFTMGNKVYNGRTYFGLGTKTNGASLRTGSVITGVRVYEGLV